MGRPFSIIRIERKGRQAMLMFKRGLFTVLVALVTTMSVYIAGPATPAAALLAIPPAVVTVAEGVLVTGAEVTGVAALPWILGVAALGYIAYSAKDTWLPWLDRLFAKPPQGAPDGTNPQPAAHCLYRMNFPPPSSEPGRVDGILSGVGSTDLMVGDWCGADSRNMSLGNERGTVRCLMPNGTVEERGQDFGFTGTGTDLKTACVENGRTGVGRVIYVAIWPNDQQFNWSYAAGSWSASDPAAVAALNGTRETTTTKTCMMPDGSVQVQKVTYVGVEGVPSGGMCPTGSAPTEMTVTTGYGAADQRTVIDYKAGNATDQAAHPACYSGAVAICKNTVSVDGQQCAVGVAVCQDWQNLDPARVRCNYGPTYTVPVADCSALEKAYVTGYLTIDPQTGGKWLPVMPDGSPWTPPRPNPDPTPTGTATADPTPTATGQPQPQPTGTPNPTATATLAPNPDPTATGNPNPTATGNPNPTGTAVPNPTPTPTGTAAPTGTGTPGVDPTANPNPTGTPAPTGMATATAEPNPNPSATPTPPPTVTPVGPPGSGNPAPDPSGDPAGDSCFPSGWHVFNPLEWVYKPVKCVVLWAFVPPAGAMTEDFNAVRTQWTDSGPGRWAGYVGGVVGTANQGGGGSCEGPPLVLPATKFSPTVTMHLLSACASPMSVIAGICKAALTLGVWLGAFFIAARAILGAFGIKIMDAFGRDTE